MKKVLMLAICFYFVLSTNLFAYEVEQRKVELGTELSYIRYEEPGVMEEKGLMYGLNGAYTERYYTGYMLKADGRLSWGKVDYKNSGTIDNVDDFIFELRGIGGYDLHTTNAIFTPFVGIGYRYLNDDLGGRISSTGARGYERESNYFYSPIGIEANTTLDNGWSIGAVVEYDHFWRGWQESHLSDASLGYNDLENTQDEGYGARAALKFSRQLENIDVVIEPFIRYWDIEQSDTANVTYSGVIIGYGYEPKNNSIEVGAKIAFIF